MSGGLPNRDVYIYWQHIPDHLKNGDNFEYKIISVEENGHERLVQAMSTAHSVHKLGLCYPLIIDTFTYGVPEIPNAALKVLLCI